MDFFISPAHAQAAQQQADPFGFLLPMLIIVTPLTKHQNMLSLTWSLKRNRRVFFANQRESYL